MTKKLAMLASDADLAKVRFPCLVQPKVDGVRGINFTGKLTGRSLEAHANVQATAMFSAPQFLHLDGELAAGKPYEADLCRKTTSVMNRIAGPATVRWFLFDCIADPTKPYAERLATLVQLYTQLKPEHQRMVGLLPTFRCESLAQLQLIDDRFIDLGYEGTIIRDPWGLYKHGRSTAKEGGLLRLKQFIEAEAVVVELLEGEANTNEAQLDARGLTKRSTHKENMIKNGMVGSLLVRAVQDIVHRGDVLFKQGQTFIVGAGRMSHAERLHYWKHPELLVDQLIKFKTFPTGVKDKPRFPTFQTIRMKSDT